MTSLFLLISKFFKWSFGFFEFAGNFINWILFFGAVTMFCYWCYVLVKNLGNNKDRDYHSPTEGKFPYYDPNIYKKADK